VSAAFQQYPLHIRAQLAERAEQRKEERASSSRSFERYRGRPDRYAAEVLKVEWWAKQLEVAGALNEYGKVFVQASNDVGKTFLAGGLVNYWFDCFNPGKALTTAPNKDQVIDLTWGEVRSQRKSLPRLQPKAPRLEGYCPDGQVDPQHLAVGITARDYNAFQGRHEEHLLIIFEEAVGIGGEFWTAADGMLSSGAGNKWLAIMNPTDTSSAAYLALQEGGWHVITMSALDHPNLAAELRGLPKPFPKAIALSAVEERLGKWCTKIPEADYKPVRDVIWPPLDFCNETGTAPSYYRPGGLFESRVLGRWPSQSSGSVWSDAAWEAALMERPDLAERRLELATEAAECPPEIGADIAAGGADDSAFHVRRGPVSLHHEHHSAYTIPENIGRLKRLAEEYGNMFEVEAKKVAIKVDDDGVGKAVSQALKADGYKVTPINAGSNALEPEKYPSRRSEMWFVTAERAMECRLDLSRLDKQSKALLRHQFMAPKWKIDQEGRRVVEPKADTKKRIKRSPDDADACNLAYAAPKHRKFTAY
jgi:hypothetical protein